MKKLNTLLAILSIATLSATFTTTAMAQPGGGDQPAPGQQGGQGGQQGGRRGNWNPEQMRQQMLDRMREQLDVKDDEEWKVLSAKIEKVFTLERQANGGGMGMMMMMRGGRGGQGGQGGPGGAGPGPGGPGMMNMGAAAEKANELRTAAADKATSDADLKTKIEAVREARKTAREDLAKAQKELQELLTVRQEAILVSFGLLD